MVKDSLIICDHTGIVLNDGVTLVPGYIEIKDNTLTRYASPRDPHNELAKVEPWRLHNRTEYKEPVETEYCIDKRLQGKHFYSKKAMDAFVESLDKNT